MSSGNQQQRVKSEKVSPCVHKKDLREEQDFSQQNALPHMTHSSHGQHLQLPFQSSTLTPVILLTLCNKSRRHHQPHHLDYALKNRYSWWRMFFCFPGPRVNLHVGVDTGSCWGTVHSQYSRGPQGPRRQAMEPQCLSCRVVLRQCAEFLNHIFKRYFVITK